MAVKTYSKKASGNKYLINDVVKIKIREAACNDGSNAIKISSRLPAAVSNIAKMLKSAFKIEVGSVIINSGYRTKAYDKKVGGSGSGPHTRGWAWDVVFRNKAGKVVNQKYVLLCAELVGGYIKGLEKIISSNNGAVHIDVERSDKWYAYQRKVSGRFSYPTVSSWFSYYGVKKPAKKSPLPKKMTKLQKRKKVQSLIGTTVDGVWGSNSKKKFAAYIKSKARVKKLQKLLNTWTSPDLKVDGLYGDKSKKAMNAIL